MSSNFPGNPPGFAGSPGTYTPEHQEGNQNNAANIPPKILSNDAAFQLHMFRAQQRKYTLQAVLFLLVALCLGSLGALSLAPALFPQAVQALDATQPVGTQAAQSNLQKNGCTAQPADMKYAHIPGKKKGDSLLPHAWFQAGRSQNDLLFAKACAASFVNAYQTFNATDTRTFESCAFMLSDGGKQRFYGLNPNVPSDEHMLPMWRASMQQQQVQQAAQAGEPRFMVAQSSTKLLAWMLVSYQRSIRIAGGPPVVATAQMMVLLVSMPVHDQETGWQVSQWQNGNTSFPPSALL